MASSFEGLGGRFAEIKASFSSMGGESNANDKVGDFKGLESELKGKAEEPPGFGVGSLVYVDVILLYSLIMICLPLIVSAMRLSQLQGILSLIFGIVVLIMSFIFILKIIAKLFLMIGLLLAIPFGTIIYMIIYASFETGTAAAFMSSLMVFKIALAALLLAAHERFIMNIGLIAVIATSMVCMIIVSFLHNLVPGFLVSITDAIAGLVVCIIAIIWSIVLIISGLIGILMTLKSFNKLVKA